VTIATHPDHATTVNAARPELLVYGVRTARDVEPLIKRATVIALGPGLSQDAWARGVWRAALASRLPLVVDADGLNLLAAGKPARKKDWILTPHPGEAARLLKTTADAVQRDRFVALKNLAKRLGGVCVLKGAGTLLTGGDGVWLCDRGNAGLASGGTGDVLTGVIAALRAQGASALDAARLGVWLHAAAGDELARQGEAGCLATDLYVPVRQRLNELTREHAKA
jgi:NAD(P)H-hydrate epimerase